MQRVARVCQRQLSYLSVLLLSRIFLRLNVFPVYVFINFAKFRASFNKILAFLCRYLFQLFSHTVTLVKVWRSGAKVILDGLLKKEPTLQMSTIGIGIIYLSNL